MAYDQRALAGVGGWLAFFVITLGLLTPLRTAFEFAATLNGAAQFTASFGTLGQPLMIFELAIMAGAGIGCVFLAWRLMVTETWQTVRMTIAGLWLLGPGLTLLDLLVVVVVGGADLGALAGAIALPSIQTVGYATLWTAYLLRSDRVANTYLRDAPEAELEAVFR